MVDLTDRVGLLRSVEAEEERGRAGNKVALQAELDRRRVVGDELKRISLVLTLSLTLNLTITPTLTWSGMSLSASRIS